jgi:hypothetical protein
MDIVMIMHYSCDPKPEPFVSKAPIASDPVTAMKFLDLPMELTEYTLVHLHPLEILRCRQESRDII